jgi:hypothetical protein
VSNQQLAKSEQPTAVVIRPVDGGGIPADAVLSRYRMDAQAKITSECMPRPYRAVMHEPENELEGAMWLAHAHLVFRTENGVQVVDMRQVEDGIGNSMIA